MTPDVEDKGDEIITGKTLILVSLVVEGGSDGRNRQLQLPRS
jgi:hypothetical protein